MVIVLPEASVLTFLSLLKPGQLGDLVVLTFGSLKPVHPSTVIQLQSGKKLRVVQVQGLFERGVAKAKPARIRGFNDAIPIR
jgi:hypothetical protein